MPWWPFADERSFWEWAWDPFAELMDQDEDLLLKDVVGFPLLIAAADIGECPKQQICRVVLENLAGHVAWRRNPGELGALRAAAELAHGKRHPYVREWAVYAQRLLRYCAVAGPVNQGGAQQMAADMFAGPVTQWRWQGDDWLTVAVSGGGRLWECASRYESSHLFINRRTGTWRVRHPTLMTDAERASL
jgi:hypothetical protein